MDLLWLAGIAVVWYLISEVIIKPSRIAERYATLEKSLRLEHSQAMAKLKAEEEAWKVKTQANMAAWAREVQERTDAIEQLSREKSAGFPWLANAYAEFYHLLDLKKASSLERKKRPAPRAAEAVREIAHQRRVAEKLQRIYRSQLEYYESLFPWLVEFKEEGLDELIRQATVRGITEEPDDAARRWLTDSEYDKLSTADKYQLALDRYHEMGKTRWEVGRDYERYIGFTYETKGWQVVYQGIIKGYEDLGRDLIASRDQAVHIIQCKRWSETKEIHEKHVFQLYGTVVAYRIDHPQAKDVKGILVTTTTLSERAREFARVLSIEYVEREPLRPYPCIKCNVSRSDGTKIYHLPFDQQYDRTNIEQESPERYVNTVHEAELLGFRRARKWRGSQQTTGLAVE